jgi:hypothetical protein
VIQDARTQAEIDQEHLQLLSVLYMVYGGLAALAGLAGLCVVLAGVMIGAGGAAAAGWGAGWGGATADGWPAAVIAASLAGLFLIFLGGAVFVLAATSAVLRFLTAFALRQHRHRTFCLVIAVLVSLHVPLGSLLGIATLLVLLRPSVEHLFVHGQPPPSALVPRPAPPGAPVAAGQ